MGASTSAAASNKYQEVAGRSPSGVSSFLLDEASLAISRLIEQHSGKLEVDHAHPRREARAEFAARIGAGLEGRDAAEALEEYILELERRIAPIAARRSRLFWFFLSRRLPPVPIHGARAWTAVLYHTVFTLALLKHGNRDADDEFLIRGDQVLPAEVELGDVLGLYQLLELRVRAEPRGRGLPAGRQGRGAAPVSGWLYDTGVCRD